MTLDDRDRVHVRARREPWSWWKFGVAVFLGTAVAFVYLSWEPSDKGPAVANAISTARTYGCRESDRTISRAVTDEHSRTGGTWTDSGRRTSAAIKRVALAAIERNEVQSAKGRYCLGE